jgi:adenosylcobyric acid synthase
MKIAELADSPVLLVSDIDRGGAFASIIGTMNLLKPEHRARVRGFILNKFRGDVKLLEPGLETVKDMTGTPVIGVLPYIHGLSLPDEDSVSLENTKAETTRPIKIAVIRFPRISNFTDFESLQSHPMINLIFVASKDDLLDADMIILPGTKNTIKDLEWLRNLGMSSVMQDLASIGIPIVGICGGYQMLGKSILDEKGIESGSTKSVDGLGLLDISTSFGAYDKVTKLVSARVVGSGPLVEKSHNQELSGYEIHMGKTVLGPTAKPFLRIFRGQEPTISDLDGAMDEKGLIFGSYLHGIFDKPPLRESMITYLAARKGIISIPKKTLVEEEWESGLERIVEAVEKNLNMTLIFDLVGMKRRQ